jgi:hypothetical protein
MPVPISGLILMLLTTALFFLPGSAWLVVSQTWLHWPGLQRYFVAIGLSIVTYPVLFYMARFLLPGIELGPWTLAALLLLALIVTGWGIWKRQAFSLRLTTLEWAAVVILGLTFISRFWIVYTHPYPAWSDSLHHTLLTQLTAENGRLPDTLEPYFPNLLAMYHLGLYALSGSVAMLAQVPAHTALLWTAQFLNSLCGIGIYLALDRYAGRVGAVVGLAIAGLFSAHPALWVNWGRFTQISSQVIFLFAWVFTLESVGPPRPLTTQKEQSSRPSPWILFFAVLSTAAVFFFHFRVAIFYFLLLFVTLIIIFWQRRTRWQQFAFIKRLTAVGGASLVIVLPVLWEAAQLYLARRTGNRPPLPPEEAQQLRQNYHLFPLSTIPYLAAPVWLLTIGGVAAAAGLIRRNLLVIISIIWMVLLAILGNAYLLDIPILNITNLGAILIMFYLPLSLIIGAVAEMGLSLLPPAPQKWARHLFVLAVLAAALPATAARATTLELFRHFITPQDVEAMAWIQDNIPLEAKFAINTYFWLPQFAHGTDAGYWIPYFTGRQITTSSMLSDGISPTYRQHILDQSRATEALETDLNALDELYDLGVEYIYIGARGDFSGPGLQPDFLVQSAQVELLYENKGVAILHITDNR